MAISADVISRSAVNSSNFDRHLPKILDFGDRFGDIPDPPKTTIFDPKSKKTSTKNVKIKKQKIRIIRGFGTLFLSFFLTFYHFFAQRPKNADTRFVVVFTIQIRGPASRNRSQLEPN